MLILIDSSASYTRYCNNKLVESDRLKAYPDRFSVEIKTWPGGPRTGEIWLSIDDFEKKPC